MKSIDKKWDASWKTSQHNQERSRRTPETPGWIRSLKDTNYSVGDLVYVNTSPDKVNRLSAPSFPGHIKEIPTTGMSLLVEFEPQPGAKMIEMLYPVWKLRHATVEEALDPHGIFK